MQVTPFGKSYSGNLNNDDEEDARARLQSLRAEMERAVEAEQYGEAARLRDEMRNVEADAPDEVSVLLANEQFYDALRAGSAEDMGQAWLNGDDVSVALVLSGLVVGYDAVIAEWRKLFGMGVPTGVKVEVLGVNVRRNLAWVVCEQVVEGVRARAAFGADGVATNFFQKRRGQWRMVHHHASPVVVTEDGDDKRREK